MKLVDDWDETTKGAGGDWTGVGAIVGVGVAKGLAGLWVNTISDLDLGTAGVAKY